MGITMVNESINPWRHLGVRPDCPCCGGGKKRDGYAYPKAKSRRKSKAAARESFGIDKRTRRAYRPDKYGEIG